MTTDLLLLCLAAFTAGFVDAVSGGGGLIQTPVSLIVLPHEHFSNVIGTIKIPAFSGSFLAVLQYLKKVSVQWKKMILLCSVALISSYIGSLTLTKVNSSFFKPLLLIILIIVAVYVFVKKDFGVAKPTLISEKKIYIYSILISLILGFYDGFIGPGAGVFLILAFITYTGFDFLKASAYAKLINLTTNLGSIILFFSKGLIIWSYAIPMAFCNAMGGYIGAKTAIKKGNLFFRIVFISVVTFTIIRFTYDIFYLKH